MSKASKLSRTRGADYEAPAPVPKSVRMRGRPTEYDPEMLSEASRLAAQGLDMQEIAEELGVHRKTVWVWRYRYPEFGNALREGGAIADDRVEMALERTAREGNVTAQIFWLKNRRPEKWRDRKETEIIVPEADAAGEPDQRQLALQALALFNGAVYDPEDDTPAEGLVIEGHAREEIDDGETLQRDAEPAWPPEPAGGSAVEPPDPDFDDRDPDFDLGDV